VHARQWPGSARSHFAGTTGDPKCSEDTDNTEGEDRASMGDGAGESNPDPNDPRFTTTSTYDPPGRASSMFQTCSCSTPLADGA